ncbi:MAG: methylmalonyl-CoA epimerase [Dehalococcoidia bacterium]|nr:methylmalonyl-CoA epimerase [Dehalococcoidia bacterium]MCH2312771.1 methylmalonyl-CoA epimerase [SAR202 cluster bacterium]MCS5650350.1 methylmalonyl-CoA epimerase [Dehalococcoidia bacterium]HAT21259.1 methylmalonyl-CoA epimerase [Dehalococcoidia bacterium]HBF00784.1 methylmalonyl-CoA epimerase [Dehalococcoidia bacterium]
MNNESTCSARHINHVCIAVLNIEETLAFYENLFGVTKSGEIETIEDQGVKAALVRVGASQLEFIQPIDNENGVAKFIERRGEGVHHICFEVDNLESKLNDLDLAGVQLIDKEPRDGLSGTIGFIHPKSTRGVLIELVDQKTARR